MHEDIKFELNGITFNRIVIDDSASIEFVDTVTYLRINAEGSFGLTTSECESKYDVEKLNGLDRLLKLLGKPLSHCIVSKEGDLTISFCDGTCLSIESDPQYETWHLFMEKCEVHSTPGGGCTIFDKDPELN